MMRRLLTDPAPGLERIQATLLAINSADDEHNPPELRIMERELKRVKGGKFYMARPEWRSSGRGSRRSCWRGRRGGK